MSETESSSSPDHSSILTFNSIDKNVEKNDSEIRQVFFEPKLYIFVIKRKGKYYVTSHVIGMLIESGCKINPDTYTKILRTFENTSNNIFIPFENIVENLNSNPRVKNKPFAKWIIGFDKQQFKNGKKVKPPPREEIQKKKKKKNRSNTQKKKKKQKKNKKKFITGDIKT